MSARRDVALVMAEHGLGERYACRLLEVDRSTYRYEARPDRNAKLRDALLALARQYPRYGYRRLWALLVRQGWEVDVKRVHRLYKAEGLMVRRLKRKRVTRSVPINPLLVRPNQEWAMDFVSDALATGRALRTFTLIDSYTKECLTIEVNTGISSREVTRVLERVIEERGAPGCIRCDNGSEFTSLYFVEWCKQRSINAVHIQPGKPVQNGHVESFNGRFRDECLNTNWFVNLTDARRKIEAWRKEYNEERPHRQPGLPNAGRVRQNLLRTHQQDGRHPTGPPVGFGGSHGGARRQGFADALPWRAGPCRLRAAVHRRMIATGGSGGMAKGR